MYNRKSRILNLVIIITSLFCTAVSAADDNGIIKIISQHEVAETINKLEAVLRQKGMTIFARVDHSAGADKAGIQLRSTELLIFGNPKVGTPLMQCSQTAALDLPQKALAYKDDTGQVWLAYNDPAYMAKRHSIKGCKQALEKVSNALAKFTKLAAE